jgi:hypothetical protein
VFNYLCLQHNIFDALFLIQGRVAFAGWLAAHHSYHGDLAPISGNVCSSCTSLFGRHMLAIGYSAFKTEPGLTASIGCPLAPQAGYGYLISPQPLMGSAPVIARVSPQIVAVAMTLGVGLSGY